MHEIKLPKYNVFTTGFCLDDIRNLPLVTMPGGNKGYRLPQMGGDEQSKDLSIARKNGTEVINSSLRIEKRLSVIISSYLFPNTHQVSSQRFFFIHEILETDKFSMHFKKEIVLKIIKDFIQVHGSEFSRIEKGLAQIIRYRNAFAHGELSYDATQGVVLKYYSGSNKTEVLSDDFLQGLEATFKDMDQTLDIMYNKMLPKIKPSSITSGEEDSGTKSE